MELQIIDCPPIHVEIVCGKLLVFSITQMVDRVWYITSRVLPAELTTLDNGKYGEAMTLTSKDGGFCRGHETKEGAIEICLRAWEKFTALISEQ